MDNAGISLTEDLLDIEPEDWEADLQINLTGHLLGTRKILSIMIQSGGGSIINTSSVNGI